MRNSQSSPRWAAQAIATLLCLSILAGACGMAPEPRGGPPADVQEARSALARDLAPAAAPPDLEALSASNRAFAFNLYQALRSEDGNLFFSPTSISLALAMTYAGARGETEQQMAAALRFELPQERLHPAFNALDLALTGQPRAEQAFSLEIANAVWAQRGYPIHPDFLDTLAVNYGAGLRLVDFIEAGHREQARLAINGWVNEQTAGKIPEVLEQDILDDFTRLVLANAIYFNGEWAEPFPAGNTEAEPFHLLDGTQVNVPTMSLRTMTGYVEGPNYQAVELAYKGDRVRMLILVPAEGQFSAFEQTLEAEQAAAILAAMQPTDVKLYLPKFSYDASLMLKEALSALGMPDAFDPDRADFSGIAPIPPRLYLSAVVHKAFVAVDELGTEAAAATGVVAEIVSMPKEVRADRPFSFLIYDAETETVLFLGRVLNPAQ